MNMSRETGVPWAFGNAETKRKRGSGSVWEMFYPIGSMVLDGIGIFTYIYHQKQPNVGKYIIHESYGYML